jgi:hypothetical protein
MTDRTMEKWKQLAIHIGEEVYRGVNTANYVGTDDETGYLLMFFNAKNHHGKSTLVSSEVDRAGLKRLLKEVLRNIDHATVIEQRRPQ